MKHDVVRLQGKSSSPRRDSSWRPENRDDLPAIAFAGWLEFDDFSGDIYPTDQPESYYPELAASEWDWRRSVWRSKMEGWLEETGQKKDPILIVLNNLWERIKRNFK